MALSDEQIDAVTLSQWCEMKGYPLAAHRAYARAVEAEVRKQDEALTKQLMDGMACLIQAYDLATYGGAISTARAAVNAARLRLEGKP